MNVPLMFRIPGREPAVRTDVAALTDVPATLLASVGEVPPAGALPGRDLLAEGAEHEASRIYLSTFGTANQFRFALIEGQYKMVISQGDGIWEGRLTRIGRDNINLTAGAPQVAKGMREQLMQIRAEMLKHTPAVTQELDAEERAALSALGYLSEDESP
jgi:arylsulfatase A-like enzyme